MHKRPWKMLKQRKVADKRMPAKSFRVLTDSACDMPVELEKASGVEIMNFGITLDGAAYTERESFTFDEYYDMLRSCEGIPSTAHVTSQRFLDKFLACHAAGVEEVLYVSINASGSATRDAAVMAREAFAEKHPQSGMRITIVDSHCYSMAYGWFVAQAARRLGEGEPMEQVAAWLNDVFTRVEILLAAFSLKFMKKSGRISAAAAFAGELLGLRPIITLNDGVSNVEKKVRGDKEVLTTMLDYASEHRDQPEPYLVGGTDQAVIDELAAMCAARWGAPPVSTFMLGAAVATNTGPDAIAIVYMGPQRRQPDAVSTL